MEMRREWVRPLTKVQQFVPNEYCSSCGESGKTYYFQCNAPKGTLYYYDQQGKSQLLGGFYPDPNVVHVADSEEYFPKGFIDYNRNRKEDVGEAVIVWIEYDRRGHIKDYHATKELDITKWETQKS